MVEMKTAEGFAAIVAEDRVDEYVQKGYKKVAAKKAVKGGK